MIAHWLAYRATNRINKKRYIGITGKGLSARKRRHLYRASINDKGCPRFYDAIRKYGKNAFDWEILSDNLTREEAEREEIRLIELHKPEYNVTPGGKSGPLTPHNKIPVICLNDGMIFGSLAATSRFYKITISEVCESCKGAGRKSKGLHFAKYGTPLSRSERLSLIVGRERSAIWSRSWKARGAEWKRTEMLRRTKGKRAAAASPYNVVEEGKDRLGRSAAGPMRNARKVICLDDSMIFDSASAAAETYGASKSAIIELCLGQHGRRTVRGKRFAYIEG